MSEYVFQRVKAIYSNGKIDPSAYEKAIADSTVQGLEFIQIFVENPAASVIDYVLIFKRSTH